MALKRMLLEIGMGNDLHGGDYTKAALVHTLGATLVDKVHFTYGLYMATFFCDPTAFTLNLLEQ